MKFTQCPKATDGKHCFTKRVRCKYCGETREACALVKPLSRVSAPLPPELDEGGATNEERSGWAEDVELSHTNNYMESTKDL